MQDSIGALRSLWMGTSFMEASMGPWSARTATRISRGIRTRTRLLLSSARPAMRTRRRACGSVHADGKEHPCTSCHGNAHEDSAQDRSTLGGVSAECAEDLRQLPRYRGDGQEHGAGERVSAVHDSIHGFRAEQRKGCWWRPTATVAWVASTF